MTTTPSTDDLLRTFPESVQRLAEHARRWIRRWLPDAAEEVDVAARLISYQHGPGYKGMVCTLIPSKVGIKLGIVGGATIPDPHHLLTGTGKVHRHVPLSKPEDLERAGLTDLILAASAACRARLEAGPRARR